MAEVVNGLAEEVASIAFVGGYFRHGEIRLTECCSCRVHPDENLGDRFDVQIFGQFDDAKVIVHDFSEFLQNLAHFFSVGTRVLRNVIFS